VNLKNISSEPRFQLCFFSSFQYKKITFKLLLSVKKVEMVGNLTDLINFKENDT